MNAKRLLYWTTTSFIALETFSGGVVDLMHGRTNVVSGPKVADVVTGLGYPTYILEILGAWKIPGAIVLVLPRFRRLKEWAYAGIVFELSGAAASQAIRGKSREVIAPAVLLALTLASWALRPPNRTLGAAPCRADRLFLRDPLQQKDQTSSCPASTRTAGWRQLETAGTVAGFGR